MAHGPLPQAEFEAIYAKVPRLTVEVVITGADGGGVLLSRRERGPCQGLWHIPGGTVRFGEHLTEAVQRVPLEELGLSVVVGNMLGYIEYPSHLSIGDWPVGVAFQATATPPARPAAGRQGGVAWFTELPEEMHDEQKAFLRDHGLAS